MSLLQQCLDTEGKVRWGEGRCLSEVLLEFRTIVSGNSSCKASDDRDDRAGERGREATKRVETSRDAYRNR